MSSLVVPDEDKQPVDWAAVDEAIYKWATGKLGLEALWENQNATQPPYPYLSLLRENETDEGGIDELRVRTIADDETVMEPGSVKTPKENEEIVYQPIQFRLSVRAHVDFDSGGNDPSCDAKQLLGKLKRTLRQSSTIQTFNDAGLSVVGAEAIPDVSLLINGEWISRAPLDVIFRTASVMTERVEFIDKVQLKSDDLGVDITVDAS